MPYQHWFRMFADDHALNADEIRTELIKRFGVEAFEGTGFLTPALHVSVRQTDEEDLNEARSKHPGVIISFHDRRDVDLDGAGGDVNMVQIVDWLLHTYTANVDFKDDDEGLALFRNENRVTVVSSDFWTYDPRIRPMITVPHVYRNAGIDHWLKIRFAGAAPDPMVLRGFLMAKFALSPDKEHHDRAYCKDLAVQILKSDDEPGTCYVHCEVNVLHYHAAIKKMLAIYRGLLDKFPDDAVMTWAAEHAKHSDNEAPPLLTRTNNEITLSDEPDFWTPERKAIFSGTP